MALVTVILVLTMTMVRFLITNGFQVGTVPTVKEMINFIAHRVKRDKLRKEYFGRMQILPIILAVRGLVAFRVKDGDESGVENFVDLGDPVEIPTVVGDFGTFGGVGRGLTVDLVMFGCRTGGDEGKVTGVVVLIVTFIAG